MEKKISIVYIITTLELGGAQKICLSLFDNLSRKNYDTFLITGNEGILQQSILNNPQKSIIRTLKRSISFYGIFNEIYTFFSLIKKLKDLKKENPNIIVHTHSTKAGYLGRWAALCAGITYRIHTIHGFGFHDFQSKYSYFFAYSLEVITSFITTHYICVSQKDQHTGAKKIPFFSTKNSLIRAAVCDKTFIYNKKIKKNNKKFIYGTISCFKKQKNIFDLLIAFKNIYKNYPDTHLEIIGDGTLRPLIEDWIAKNILHNAITLHGWQQNVYSFMEKWHVFVLSSLWEGLPCAAVEARFLKIPVLAYEVGGLPEIIITGKNGFLYKPKDIISLTQGMKRLLLNKCLYNSLKNHDENLSSFTINAMLLEHTYLYKNILNKNKKL